MNGQTKNSREKVKDIFSIVLLLFLCLILMTITVFNLVIIVSSLVSGEPSVFNYQPLIESVQELKHSDIKAGDMVLLNREDKTLEQNDIVGVFYEGRYSLKKIEEITIQNNIKFYKVSSDLEPNSVTVTGANILGKYELRIPFLGSFLLFTATPWGAVALIGLPTVAFLYYQFAGRKK